MVLLLLRNSCASSKPTFSVGRASFCALYRTPMLTPGPTPPRFNRFWVTSRFPVVGFTSVPTRSVNDRLIIPASPREPERRRLLPYGAGRLCSLVKYPWVSSTTRTAPDAALLLTRTLPSLPGRMIAMFDCVALASTSTVAAAGIDSSVDHRHRPGHRRGAGLHVQRHPGDRRGPGRQPGDPVHRHV